MDNLLVIKDINEKHQAMVASLAKSGEDLVAEYTPLKADLDHMAIGVSGEAGELVDAIKRFTKYNKPLDTKNVIEELGDLEFYMEHLRATLGVTREETLEANITKLAKRYPNFTYSNQSAAVRTDKIDLGEAFNPLDEVMSR